MAGRTAFVDVNGNAVLDAGEPSATTDAEGYYVIPTSYTSGTYAVRVVVPAGYACTAPAVTCANSATFTATGTNDTANSFGLLAPATVSGTAYEDADGDAVHDGAETTPSRAGRSSTTPTTTALSTPASFPRRPPRTAPTRSAACSPAPTASGSRPARAGSAMAPPAACTPSPRRRATRSPAMTSSPTSSRPSPASSTPTPTRTPPRTPATAAARASSSACTPPTAAPCWPAPSPTRPAPTASPPPTGPPRKPGSYVVRVSAPGGYVVLRQPATPPSRSISGQDLTGQDTGVYANATVTGTVFTDGNAERRHGRVRDRRRLRDRLRRRQRQRQPRRR